MQTLIVCCWHSMVDLPDQWSLVILNTDACQLTPLVLNENVRLVRVESYNERIPPPKKKKKGARGINGHV